MRTDRQGMTNPKLRVLSFVSRAPLKGSASLWTAYATCRRVFARPYSWRPTRKSLKSDALLAKHIRACYSQLNLCLAYLIAYLNAKDCFSCTRDIRNYCCCMRRMFTYVSFAHWWSSYVYLPLLRHSGVTNAFSSRIIYMYVMYIYIGGSFSNDDCKYVTGFGERKHSK